MAGMTHPPLLEQSGALSIDAINRVNTYNDGLGMPIGAYSANSKGFKFIRNKVAEFIRKRDGNADMDIDVNDIYMTNGASEGVNLCY